jgi:hypothetical protein
MSYGLDDRGFESRQELGILLFTSAFGLALGPIQSPIQWVPGTSSLWVKRPGREADHSHPCSAEVKNTPSWLGAQIYLHLHLLPFLGVSSCKRYYTNSKYQQLHRVSRGSVYVSKISLQQAVYGTTRDWPRCNFDIG